MFLLSRNHPVGDFGYCSYQWTDIDRDAYDELGIIPLLQHDLPAETPVVVACHYARYLPNWARGPRITAAEFRRLDATSLRRLLVWDIGAVDTTTTAPLLAVVPSEDIKPTKEQRATFTTNLSKKKSEGEWATSTPSVSDLLGTDLILSEYVHHAGPLAYAKSTDWAPIWAVFDKYATMAVAEHPAGRVRDCTTYRHTLQTIHQRLVREHISGSLIQTGDDDLE